VPNASNYQMRDSDITANSNPNPNLTNPTNHIELTTKWQIRVK